MERNFSKMLSVCTLMGLAGALAMFFSEWAITTVHAEIHLRTYAFFFVVYVVWGCFTGAALGTLLHFGRRLLRARWLQADKPGFLAGTILFVQIFFYGFYYINEKLTAGVGVFAPLSLIADLLFFLAAAAVFRLAVATGKRAGAVAGFLQVSLLPIALVVATNVRFFVWQPPVTQTSVLFWGVGALALAAIAGSLISLGLSRIMPEKGAAGVLISAGAAALALTLLALSGPPSADSFQTGGTPPVAGLQAGKPKNIIWIVTDTARRDHLSIYNGKQETTPALSKFAEEALVFDRAIATAPWTLPSHASMFTGMYPSKHGAHYVGDAMFSTPLLPENLTIAELLAAHGYQTAGICANNAGLSRALGCHQGFQYYFDARPLVFSLFWGKLMLALPDDFRVDELWVNEVALSSEINPVVEDWLTGHDKERPFFLFINYMEPHGGIAFIPEPYDSMYGFDRDRQPDIFQDFDADRVIHFRDEVTAEQREFWTSYVQRKLTFMDHNLDALFENLKARGLFDDALIVINSDHGELFGEHNSFGHNTDLYNELIAVPMMVKYPNSQKRGRFEKMVQTVDIMPELLAEVEIPIPENLQGQPFEQANHPVVAELFQQVHNAHAKRNPKRYFRDLKAIYAKVADDSLKYIWSSDYKSELFDLTSDPAELRDTAVQDSVRVDSMQARLDRWSESFSPMQLTNHLKTTDDAADKELRERLKSLGYLK